jgi:hypothetical protein
MRNIARKTLLRRNERLDPFRHYIEVLSEHREFVTTISDLVSDAASSDHLRRASESPA